MTVVSPMIEPNADAIKSHLSALFGLAQSEYPGGLIELRYGSPEALDNWAYFNLQKGGIEEAAKFASGRNREGQNVYVGVNPRRPNTNTKRAASAPDIEIAFFHFADIDKAESVNGLVERYGALPPTMNVTTGTVPNKRPHLYWQLEEPVRNMGEWTKRQRGIAQALGGDSVIDPPRIMRLAGTVNYPTQKKLSKGYKVELTSLKTEFANERSPVTPEQVGMVYPERVEAQIEPLQGQATSTLAAMAPHTGLRVSQALENCRNDVNWHENCRWLISHWAGIGWSTAEILAVADHITQPGYTVEQTRREMGKSLATSRAKFGNPEPEDAVLADPDNAGLDVFDFLSLNQIEDLPPPTWLIDDLVPEHGLTIVYGDPGAGKSFITLDMALRTAYGMDWHGIPTKQTGVLYIAGEGRHGIGKRVKGWRREHALEGADAPFFLQPVAVHMLDAASKAKLLRTIDAIRGAMSFPIGLVIIDTVSRSIAGQDENKQEAMSLFVDGCADIQNHTEGAVIGVHHSGKERDRGMRGSTVLLGGCDASLRVTKDEQQAKIEVEKQKDAEELAPVHLLLKKVEWSSGINKAESTLVPEKTARPTLDQKTLSRRQADIIFDEVDAAFAEGNPWSAYPQAKRTGRYLIDHIAETYELTKRTAEDFVTKWQSRGYMKTEKATTSRSSGLRVLKRLEQET